MHMQRGQINEKHSNGVNTQRESETEGGRVNAQRIFNINNDLIRVMYNCFEIVNGLMWISWASSLYTVNL